jgi:uncharacterized protein (TIGR00290 family)
MMDVLLAWSGGKDSTLALEALRAHPGYRVLGLVTTITRDYDRISIHGVRRSVLEAQVRALGLPLLEVSIASSAGNADYEAAFALALHAAQARWPGICHMAFGDLFLADVRAYRERQLAAVGWSGVFPLWGRDTTALARHFVDAGYGAVLTCVDTTQLPASFAGREFDSSLLADLPPAVDPCGERGEFHTCAYAGPLFAGPLTLVTGVRIRRDERFEYCDVLPAADQPAARLYRAPDTG